MFWLGQGLLVYLALIVFLFVPGALIQANVAVWLPHKGKECYSFEAGLINSFILSVGLNIFVTLMLAISGRGIDQVKYIIIFLMLLFASTLFVGWRLLKRSVDPKFIRCSVDWRAYVFISMVFILMAYQGGLLDFMADGWLHMSYANRMVQDNSFFVESHMLVGYPTEGYKVLYPPFWHLQLALVSELSNIPVPVIWHFVSALSVSLLLLAYYLLVRVLGGSHNIALLAIILHSFLIGGLVSYYRVAPWPGNIAYILLFYSFNLTFKALEQFKTIPKQCSLRDVLFKLPFKCLLLLLLTCILLTGLHGVELVLYILGIGSYLLAISYIDLLGGIQRYNNDKKALGWIFVIGLVCSFIAALTFFSSHLERVFSMPRAQAPYLNFIVPAVLLIYLALGAMLFKRSNITIIRVILRGGYLFVWVLILWFVIDIEHVKQLFVMEKKILGVHVPGDFYDRFNNRVYLPFWIYQLRGGLLLSGVISIALAITFLVYKRDRLSVFLGANAVLVLFTLTSPYIFTFISFMIPLSSVYRVQMLLFSPIILAVFIDNLLLNIRPCNRHVDEV